MAFISDSFFLVPLFPRKAVFAFHQLLFFNRLLLKLAFDFQRNRKINLSFEFFD
jgi:hypothetical protein